MQIFYHLLLHSLGCYDFHSFLILFYINEDDNCLDKYPINISILVDKSYKLKLRMNENHNNQENVVIDEEIYRNRFSIQSTDFIKMIKYLQDITKRLDRKSVV